MKIRLMTGALAALSFFITPAWAADDAMTTRLATCQDSWFEWSKADPVQMKKFVDHIRAGFTPHGNDPYMVPKTSISIAGMPVTQVFPQSIGMGLGFSATVALPFEKARAALEKAAGKKLGHCEASDGMHSCGLQIADKRTIMATAVDGEKPEQTQIGCYYYYEK